MKCPKCGKELKDGQLYCEECGNEIQIVPDFDPEFELEIHETLSGLAEEIVIQDKADQSKENMGPKVWYQKIRSGKYFSIIGVILPALFILLSVFAGISTYQYNSYNFQINKAIQYAKAKNYEQAIQHMKRAMSISKEEETGNLLLADYYNKDGQTENAIITLQDYIATYEDSEDAYRMLIKIYENSKDYEAINNLLQECSNDDIIAQFNSYIAFPPEFSLQEDTYDQVVPLKLSANTTGEIYYTMDGEEPTKASKKYTAPIFLEKGEYVIKAVFINQYGTVSECAEKKITIEVMTPLQPDVNLYSGVYNYPQTIEVDNQGYGTTYYTTDGTVPTKDSIEYTGPIYMPLGESRYQFITYGEDGSTSEITERIYELKLNRVNIKAQDAINATTLFLYENNYIIDVQGHLSNATGRYIYTCNTAITINGVTYYLVLESYVDTMNTQIKTGNQFAVNAMTGAINKAQLDTNGNYVAIPF